MPKPNHPYLNGEKPIAFAHRGGAKVWPENTLFAFERAIALGYRYIETDVHLSSDGEIVIFHDQTLERTTNGTGPLRALPLESLRSLDAGFGFTPDGGATFPFRGQGIRIPTLNEALDLGDEIFLNLEIKQWEPDMADALLQLIDDRGVHDRVLVGCANDAAGRRFRELAGGRVCTSPGYEGVLKFWLGARTGLHRLLRPTFDALQVPHHHGRLTVVDERFVDAAHHHGIAVHVWTVDDADEMRQLLDMGVDAIMTDMPETLLDVLGRSPAA